MAADVVVPLALLVVLAVCVLALERALVLGVAVFDVAVFDVAVFDVAVFDVVVFDVVVLVVVEALAAALVFAAALGGGPTFAGALIVARPGGVTVDLGPCARKGIMA